MESTEHTSQDTETEMSTIRRRAPKPRRLTILHEVRSGRVFIPSAADGNHHWLARRYPWLRQGAPWRVRMHNLIEEPRSSRLAAIVYLFLMSLVLISAIVLCLDTLPQYEDNTAIFAIECVCATFFSIEFATRLLSWQDDYVSIIWSPSIYIDLLSVMPFFIQQILGDDSGSDDGAETADGVLVNSTDSGTTAKDGLQVIGIMRLLRLLRLLKLVRHYEGSAVLANALERSLSALLVPLFFLTLLCFVFAGLIYYIEGVISDNEDFDNIFKSAWFVLVTLSTVGYGDISPVSWYGKVVTVPMIICGVLFMAMPVRSLATASRCSISPAAADLTCACPSPSHRSRSSATTSPSCGRSGRSSSSSPRSTCCSSSARSPSCTPSRSSARWTPTATARSTSRSSAARSA